MITDPNACVFPVTPPLSKFDQHPPGYPFPAAGMTKREYFAGLALYANRIADGISARSDSVAASAVRDADALIAELSKA